MRIPRMIYEIYPIVYVVGGIATISSVESAVAIASGLLLSISGVAILFIRRNYRAMQELIRIS